ncbi:MAG: hypothetical protein NTY96_06815 [Bacteroidetes bacterium]|nr:hypothetical protein [Bacteroidota bacterium]
MKANTQFSNACNAIASCVAFKAGLAMHLRKTRPASSWLSARVVSLILDLHIRTLRKYQVKGKLHGKMIAGTTHYLTAGVIALMKKG